jgi:glycosyltransferase involved in cell wall biosynthesis
MNSSQKQRLIKVAILADFPISALGGEVSGRGGGQQSTWLPQLAQAFELSGDLDIHWLILDRSVKKTTIIEKHNQTFHRIPSGPFTIDLAFNYLPARRSLRKVVRRISPDIIHAWGTETKYPAALMDFGGTKILSMQGIISEYMRIKSIPNTWRWRKMAASESKFIRAATIITSESQWGIDKVREIVPEAECRIVEYGVHPSFYEIEWKPEPTNPYALYIGGGGNRKGLDILIDAVTTMNDRKWELRVAGAASEIEQDLLARIPSVKYLGMLSWDEMRKQLEAAWCSVLPTRADTSPNSVKEARVVGLPVVTTLNGGQAGYIRDGENGRIVAPLTAEGLALALTATMASYEGVLTMGRTRHHEDRAYLSASRTAAGFSAIYHELGEQFSAPKLTKAPGKS